MQMAALPGRHRKTKPVGAGDILAARGRPRMKTPLNGAHAVGDEYHAAANANKHLQH
jgi:hypothetical protein